MYEDEIVTTTTEDTLEEYEGWENFWNKRSVKSFTNEYIKEKNSTLIFPKTFTVSISTLFFYFMKKILLFITFSNL